MTHSEKRKAQLLIVLLVIAGAIWFVIYRPGSSATTGTAGTAAAAGANAAKVVPDAQIRLELLENPASSETVGRRNLFQYREKPAPPPPEPPRTVFTAPPPRQNVQIQTAPPPQPFKAFRYEGFSSASNNGDLLASLSEGGNTYTVKNGECLMGQYCVRRLTENQIEIEDLQSKRRQTFPRIQQ